jgi:hypothetical protein
MRTSVVAIVLLAGVACSSPHEHPRAVPRLEATSDTVGVEGLWLGMSHQAAEHALDSALPIHEEFAETCGSGYSNTQLAGQRVTIQWADDPTRAIESIFVSLPAEHIESALEGLSGRAGNHLERCPTGSPAAPYCFRHRKDMVVYADLDPPSPGVWLSLEDCTD